MNRIVDNSLYDTKLSSKYTCIWVEEKCSARVVLDRIIQSQISGGYALFFTINCNLLVPNYLSNDQIFIMLDSPINIYLMNFQISYRPMLSGIYQIKCRIQVFFTKPRSQLLKGY